jgi:hypothetical protein
MNSGRLAARSVTFGGLVVSLAANLLHSFLLDKVSPASVVGSMLPPFFLLGAVEVVLNVKWLPGFWSWATRITLIPIAGISFYISWLHMNELVLSWGSKELEAFLYPIMIDVSMLLSAGAMLLEDRSAEGVRSAADPLESNPRSAVPGPPADRSPDPLRTGPRTPSTPADPQPRTPEDRGPDPQRTPSGPPVPDRADPLPGTAPKPPATSAAPGAVSPRVAALIPVARPIVEADPSIGWKPLAAKLRDLGHAVGTTTAREIRAALPETDDREEAHPDGPDSDRLDVRPGEGLLRV